MSLRDEYRAQKLSVLSENIKAGNVRWRSPSNIALVKYWGKHGQQLPSNPSLSFTLDQAYSETALSYDVKSDASREIELSFTLDGREEEGFRKRIEDFFLSITDIYPFLRQLRFEIRSSNSFPHSTGIASSASGMSALALCLCSLEDRLFGGLGEIDHFRRKASFLARLGSGSACRSIFGTAAFWGKSLMVPDSSDEYAVPVTVHRQFKEYRDSILILDSGQKAISSSEGHAIMADHPFAEARFQQARNRISDLLDAIRTGNLPEFIKIVENEALTLHGLMMSSNMSYILLRPETLELIRLIRLYREETNTPVCFTLDAGPNLHLLYPKSAAAKVKEWIASSLLKYCEDGRWIDDGVGEGPVEMD